jgi:putative membrane protein
MLMNEKQPKRWPRSLYIVGEEPDPRASLANERTALAGLRTALALVATGLAAAALKNTVEISNAFTVAAIVLSFSGALLAFISVARWVQVEQALRLKKPLPAPKGLFSIAVFIVSVGVLAIIAVLL